MNVELDELRRAAHRLGLQIAIDGPAGAGKSTVGRNLAEALECPYLDTGLMYRAVTLLALRQGIFPANGPALSALAAATIFAWADHGLGTLLVNGEPAGQELRTPPVDSGVSEVSAHPEVRQVLVAQQRALADRRCVVMVGRDIGTTVLPGAPIKFWVTASPEERARRRQLEHLGDQNLSTDEILRRIRERDATDSGRTASPLRRAPGAVTIETDRLTPSEALATALATIRGTIERSEVSLGRGSEES